MENKLVAGIVAAAIAVIVLAGVLIPALDNATATTDTFTNEGYFRMSEITSNDDDVTITWDYTNPYVFTVNGVDATIPYGSTSGVIFPYSTFSSDEWAVRFGATNNGANVNLALFGANNGIIWSVVSTEEKNVTITLSGGTASFLKEGGTVTTKTYDTVFIPDDKGDYIMKKSNVPVYVNGDSVIAVTGRSEVTINGASSNYNLNVEGTIYDGFTVSVIYPTSGVTISDIVVTSTQDTEHIDLYKFDKVQFKSVDGDSNENSFTYSQMIVPYQVTAEKAQHLNDAQIVILDVIPILIIVAILLGVVAIFIIRRE